MTWPAIDPGRMRHQIKILHQVPGTGIAGAAVTWEPLLTVYAEAEPMAGTDVIKAGQDVTKLPVTWRLNYDSRIKANMRVLSLSGTHVIQAVRNVGELNVTLELTCLALGANQ